MDARTEVRSSCPYCGVGCGIVMEVEGDRITRVKGDPAHPTNRGRLCTKGSSCDKPLRAPQRLTHAAMRTVRRGPAEPVELDTAIASVADRLRDIVDAHGPDAVSLYVSGQMSIEAQYLANKFAKGYLRTQHIESNSRLCMASAGTGYKTSLGADAPPGSYEDLDLCDLFFIIGANMADCHPILFLRLLDRKRATNARLIVVDPRRTATADKADLFLQIRPGTDLALLNGLLHLLTASNANNAINEDFIATRTTGWDAMAPFLADYPPARVAEITGLAETDIRLAASWIAETPRWMTLWTMGLNQSVSGTWHTNAICNLHLATGAICKPGTGPFSLTGQPNAMGGREMGYMGPGLPGQRSALVEEDRVLVEKLWSLAPNTIRAEPGMGTVAMFEAMARGEIRACWIICTNPVASMPNRDIAIAGLQRADLVIVQDAFADAETAAYADVLLPGALWAEADGVQVNSDRTVTLGARAVPPPGTALPDWQLIARVACAMGFADAFTYADSAQVFDELCGFANPQTGYDIRGISHERLRRDGPVQWPSPPGDLNARHPIRYLPTPHLDLHKTPADEGPVFPTVDGRARFLPRPWLPRPEAPNDQFAFLFITGRLQHHWHTLTKTGRVDTLNRLHPSPSVELHPEDAAALSIANGDMVAIASPRGHVQLPAVLTDRSAPGTCFAPFHWSDRYDALFSVNAVTGDDTDPLSLQPGIKFCAVSLTPVPRAAAGVKFAGTLPGTRPDFNGDAAYWMAGFLDAVHEAPAGTATATIPADAPLDATQRLYLRGFLDGLTGGAPASRAPDSATRPWRILFASQTGRAEQMAIDLRDALASAGRNAVLSAIETCPIDDLAGTVLFVVSTFGDGDAPDHALAFWTALSNHTSPLGNLSYAVLALGDPNYRDFCGFGRALDERLSILGATRLADRLDCPSGVDEVPKAWCATLSGVPTAASLPHAPVQTRPASRKHPAHAELILNRRLTHKGTDRDARQIGFDLSRTDITYTPGSALGIWPRNIRANVDLALRAFGLSEQSELGDGEGGSGPARDILERRFDLSRPSRALLERLDRREPAYLPDLLREHSLPLEPDDIVPLLRRMQPRLYSIASSERSVGRAVHLTVGVSDDPYPGLCSQFLAQSVPGSTVEIFLQPSRYFTLPDDDVAIIMIGPGTGIAPFRGFLQERAARGACGRSWLFFGERHAEEGFYYRDELEAWRAQGVLTRLDTAFSRDQLQRIYVQHRMRQAGAELFDWLEAGAVVYVCGDAERMARDVDAALRDVVARHGHMEVDAADTYVDGLVRNRRYLRDVY